MAHSPSASRSSATRLIRDMPVILPDLPMSVTSLSSSPESEVNADGSGRRPLGPPWLPTRELNRGVAEGVGGRRRVAHLATSGGPHVGSCEDTNQVFQEEVAHVSLVFDLAEAANLAWGVAAGQAAGSLQDRLTDEARRRHLSKAIAQVIHAESRLDELTSAALLAFISETNPVQLLVERSAATESQVRWNELLAGVRPGVREVITERVVEATVSALISGLPLPEQLLHTRVDRIQHQLARLTDTDALAALLSRELSHQMTGLQEIVCRLESEAQGRDEAQVAIEDRRRWYLTWVKQNVVRHDFKGPGLWT